MIRKIEIKNAFGIREQKLDFSIKNFHKSKDITNQILRDGDKAIALIPTFLAMNATGKTSLMKAITFALRFADKDEFTRQIGFYTYNNFLEGMKNIINTGEMSLDKNPGLEITNKLFKEISFAGSNSLMIDIDLIGNRKITIKLDDQSFYVILNDDVIDVTSLINEVIFNFEIPTTNYREVGDAFLARASQLIKEKEITFYKNINEASILKETLSASNLKSISLKQKTRFHIKSLIEKWGDDVVISLLRKIDTNIENVEFDLETSSFSIYLKGINIPISANNLSFGTQKVLEIFYKSGKILKNGGIMFVDEIENGLHQSLISLIVGIFSNETINQGNAQLLLTTHLPTIFNEIIYKHNAFIHDGNKFIKINEDAAISRTEKKDSMFIAKNYYNDHFWYDNNSNPKSTLSDLDINFLIDKMSNRIEGHV